MDADLGDLMSVGILAILIAGATLVLLVRIDLAPAGRAGVLCFQLAKSLPALSLPELLRVACSYSLIRYIRADDPSIWINPPAPE